MRRPYGQRPPNMETIPHEIVLDLNWTGFHGSDVDEVVPDFLTERVVRCQLQWQPSCEGPDSYRILITIGALAALVGNQFLSELGKDMYRWCKAGLGKIFRRKPNASGWTELHFKDAVVRVDAHPAEEVFADFWLALPELITKTDLSQSRLWTVEFDPSSKTPVLIPQPAD